MPARSVTLSCPAKVNLTLAVGRPEPTDSRAMHPIASWMVAVGFSDQLKVTRQQTTGAEAPASVFALRFAADAPSPGEIDWPLQSDLTFRSHRLMELHVGRPLPIAVDLEKRIPAGAGLGGGSSDAAGMIVALNELFGLDLGVAALAQIASSLGCDVHFALAALRGQTSVLVTGSGDQLEARKPTAPLDLVLVLPPFGCPTGPVYAAWDRLAAGRGKPLDQRTVTDLTANVSGPDMPFFNDLEAAAVNVEPRLGELLQLLRNELGLPAHVTGSGAACFVPTTSPEHAKHTAARIVKQTRTAAVATQTLPGDHSDH
ncbi:MAG: hypothetical protein AAGL98_03095 [Planctomycetota bacterium]